MTHYHTKYAFVTNCSIFTPFCHTKSFKTYLIYEVHSLDFDTVVSCPSLNTYRVDRCVSFYGLAFVPALILTVGFTEAPSKVFLLFFLFSDWLKSNHLRSRIECGFLDISSPHISDNNTSDKLRNKFWREKNVQKTKFEAAEMILDP